jgi:ketosteroid isomerase-like protein
MWNVTVVAVIALLGVAPQGQGRPSPVQLPPAVARVLTDYEVAWRARDAAALARLFADGRVVVPNACPPVHSRAEVEKCYSGSGGNLSLRALSYAVDGSLGFIVGEFAPGVGDPPGGKFVLTLWKAPDGRWMIIADMDRPYRRTP